MLFNSIDFAIFLPVVFFLYWFVFNKNKTLQNSLVVVASYVFYGWWNYKFLSLILISTLVDYLIGLSLSNTQLAHKRKALLWVSIIVNLGLLGFFKYYNFFVENFAHAFSYFGQDFNISTLKVVLPVGISFYTFQTLSYTIDVYRRRMQPTKDLLAFSTFVSFFPQLVAGPIERATNLLPQFYSTRRFEYAKAVDGMRQILWGLFKKIVIADNCAEYANLIFNNYTEYDGGILLLGALFFTFQIYGDFSGYSDIAIGTARLFGVNLRQNFAFPYFSRDIAEFWRRWHISLTTWFKDYLYIPLGGSRGTLIKQLRNVFIVFIVSGFWHGDNWTFIVWGALNAAYFLPLLLTSRNRKHLGVVAENRYLPSFKEFISISTTFLLTVLAWIFFRSENIQDAFDYLGRIFSISLFKAPAWPDGSKTIILLIVLFMVVEWVGRANQFAIQNLGLEWRKSLRLAFYYLIVGSIFWFSGEQQEFIYFQF